MTTTIDGQSTEIKPIFPNNADLVRQYLTKFSATDNDYVAWDDATSVAVAFCTDAEGTSVIGGMGPFTMTAVDAAFPGWFHYVVPATVTALLDDALYQGVTIYQRVTAGAAGELRVITPRLVSIPRYTE